MTSPDMTIRDVRVTMLRVPWADDPWLKGAALGAARDILICEVETSGGITGISWAGRDSPSPGNERQRLSSPVRPVFPPTLSSLGGRLADHIRVPISERCPRPPHTVRLLSPCKSPCARTIPIRGHGYPQPVA